MQIKEEIFKKIQKHREEIIKFGVKSLGLFGSCVRNDARKKSDIDFLVEFEEGKKTFDNYMGLMFFLEDLFKSKVDLVIREDIKPLLKPYILKEVEYAQGL